MTTNDLSTKTVEELRGDAYDLFLKGPIDAHAAVITELASRALQAEKLAAEVDKLEDMAWDALGRPDGTHETSNVERLCQRVKANAALREAALLLAEAADRVCPTFDARGDASTRWSRELAPLIQSVRLIGSAPTNNQRTQGDKPLAASKAAGDSASTTAMPKVTSAILGASTSSDGDWPEDAQHEDGSYTCLCVICRCWFTGHKRRNVCKRCATVTPATAQPKVDAGVDEAVGPHDCDATRELALLRAYIESHHNGYGETGRSAGMAVPKSHLQALTELVEEQADMRAATSADDWREHINALACDLVGGSLSVRHGEIISQWMRDTFQRPAVVARADDGVDEAIDALEVSLLTEADVQVTKDGRQLMRILRLLAARRGGAQP